MPSGKSENTRKPPPNKKYLGAQRRLTLKESRLIAALAQTGSEREAALLAGYSSKYPTQSAHQALQNIRRKMPDILNEMGITAEAVIEKHLIPLMNAELVKLIQKDTTFVRVPDNATRLRALDMYFLLAGLYPPKEQITQQAATLRAIILDGPRPPRIPESKNGDTK